MAAARGCGGIGRRARFRSVCPKGRGGSSPLIRTLKLRKLTVGLAVAMAAASLSGAVTAAKPVPMTEAVVTLKAPALTAFGPPLSSARHSAYARELASAQLAAEANVRKALPGAR